MEQNLKLDYFDDVFNAEQSSILFGVNTVSDKRIKYHIFPYYCIIPISPTPSPFHEGVIQAEWVVSEVETSIEQLLMPHTSSKPGTFCVFSLHFTHQKMHKKHRKLLAQLLK